MYGKLKGENNMLFALSFFYFHFLFNIGQTARLPVMNAKLQCQSYTINVTWEKPEGNVTGYRTTCREIGVDSISEEKQGEDLGNENVVRKWSMTHKLGSISSLIVLRHTFEICIFFLPNTITVCIWCICFLMRITCCLLNTIRHK